MKKIKYEPKHEIKDIKKLVKYADKLLKKANKILHNMNRKSTKKKGLRTKHNKKWRN